MIQLKRKILITGGAGFIGSNLCEYFVKKGDEVVCFDNLSTGYLHNIQELLNYDNFTFIEGDIRDFNKCSAAVKGCEYVLHQAALGSVPRSINNPLLTNEVNISGFLNVLTAARDANVKRFIYAVSSSTYGDSESLPKIEEIIGNPLSPYAVTKYVNELYASVFNNLYGIETIGLRYFNVYGKNQDPNGDYAAVIPKFILSLINKISPTIHGDGSNSRDFTHVENVVKMNELALSAVGTDTVNEIYNTACSERTTLTELFEYIKAELIKFDPKIEKINCVYKDKRVGDIPHSYADVSKAKTKLGYVPEINIRTGLKKTVEWYLMNNIKTKK